MPKFVGKGIERVKIKISIRSEERRVGKGRERVKIKIIAPFRSFPTGKEKL